MSLRRSAPYRTRTGRIIETIASKGSFVAIHAEPLWQEQLTKQMEVHIEKAIGLSKQLWLSKDEFAALFDIL